MTNKTEPTEAPKRTVRVQGDVRFAASICKHFKPFDRTLLPTIAVGVTKCGKFRFYRLTLHWWNRGVEFSFGRGPYTLVGARYKNLMDSIHEESNRGL